jgi:RNA-directed DNA polymerase
VKPRLQDRAFLIRYADDAVMVFSCEEDARRVLDVLPKRFGKYGLALHPDKTRLVEFRRPDRRPSSGGAPSGKPGTFDMLGFTHYWDLSRRGKWVVKQKTASGRFSRALKRIGDWCRRHRHQAVRDQCKMLTQKLRGHFGYFGITGNSEAIARFREIVIGIWCKWLGRRSQRARITWDYRHELLKRYPLPPARVARPYSPA